MRSTVRESVVRASRWNSGWAKRLVEFWARRESAETEFLMSWITSAVSRSVVATLHGWTALRQPERHDRRAACFATVLKNSKS
jgi:hypothetical protein